MGNRAWMIVNDVDESFLLNEHHRFCGTEFIVRCPAFWRLTLGI